MNKILITGNLGYVGSAVTKLPRHKSKSEILGFDAGFFIGNLIHTGRLAKLY